MSARYHINPETGKPGRCEAAPGNCRFSSDGEERQHYGSQEEAQLAYEDANEHLEVAPAARKPKATGEQKPKAAKKRRIAGPLGTATAEIDLAEFRKLPLQGQVAKLAEAYGYRGEVPGTLRYQSVTPSSRYSVGSELRTGDLVNAEHGIAIYYQPRVGSHYMLLDPISGRVTKAKGKGSLTKVAGVNFGASRTKGEGGSSTVDFSMQDELEKKDPLIAEARREKDEKDAQARALVEAGQKEAAEREALELKAQRRRSAPARALSRIRGLFGRS